MHENLGKVVNQVIKEFVEHPPRPAPPPSMYVIVTPYGSGIWHTHSVGHIPMMPQQHKMCIVQYHQYLLHPIITMLASNTIQHRWIQASCSPQCTYICIHINYLESQIYGVFISRRTSKNKRIQVCENHIFKFNYLNGWHIARYLAVAMVTVNHVDASIKMFVTPPP